MNKYTKQEREELSYILMNFIRIREVLEALLERAREEESDFMKKYNLSYKGEPK